MPKKRFAGDAPFVTELLLQRSEVPSFDVYPYCLPVVKNLSRLPLHAKVTYFVGENGTGKSTLLEAIAVVAGFNPEGGSKNLRFTTRDTHSELSKYLKLGRQASRESDGFFLRAESFYNVASEIDKMDERQPPTVREEQLRKALKSAIGELGKIDAQSSCVDPEFLKELKLIADPPDTFWPTSVKHSYGGSLHAKSHGEAFLALVNNRFWPDSLYILDEPESALSPGRQLSLLLKIHDLVEHENCQFIIATHSPLLMGLPEATMYQLSEQGIEETDWRETEHYTLTKSFLDRPEVFMRHLLAQ